MNYQERQEFGNLRNQLPRMEILELVLKVLDRGVLLLEIFKNKYNNMFLIPFFFFNLLYIISSRKQSMEGHPSHNTVHVPTNSTSVEPMVFTWIVEECILAANHRQTVQCPQHGELSLAQVAPDTV